jgi:hypothetical protein
VDSYEDSGISLLAIVGVVLLLAALVKGGASTVTWLLFRWKLSAVLVKAGLVLVLLVSASRNKT